MFNPEEEGAHEAITEATLSNWMKEPWTGLCMMLNLAAIKKHCQIHDHKLRLANAVAVALAGHIGFLREPAGPVVVGPDYMSEDSDPDEYKNHVKSVGATPLSRTRMSNALEPEITTAATVMLSRMATLAYTRLSRAGEDGARRGCSVHRDHH